MSRYTILPVILLISLLSFSCSKDNTITNSSESKTPSGPLLLINTTFEDSGVASLQGWRFGDSVAHNYFQFSNDVDSNGGFWSLKAIPDTIQVRQLFYKASSSSSAPSNVYFSFDLKTFGNISAVTHCSVWSHSHNYGWSGGLGYFHDWSTVSETWTLASSQIDSVVIDFSVHGGELGDYALIDNVKLEFKSQ